MEKIYSIKGLRERLPSSWFQLKPILEQTFSYRKKVFLVRRNHIFHSDFEQSLSCSRHPEFY
jgi:hypothetical protein